MRKIIPKEIAEKSNRNKQLIAGLVLIVVMLLSTAGYAFTRGDSTGTTTKVVRNGFTFYNQNGYWLAQIGDNQFLFINNPNEIPKAGSEVNSLESYSGKPLYIASNNAEATSEIYNNLGDIALRMSYACLEDETCKGDFPIKTCEDNLIIIKEGNVSAISQENNCVFIMAPSENLTRVTDEFLFKAIGIDK